MRLSERSLETLVVVVIMLLNTLVDPETTKVSSFFKTGWKTPSKDILHLRSRGRSRGQSRGRSNKTIRVKDELFSPPLDSSEWHAITSAFIIPERKPNQMAVRGTSDVKEAPIKVLKQGKIVTGQIILQNDQIKPPDWSSWSSWSKCPKTCRRARQMRLRQCVTKSRKSSPRACIGVHVQHRTCLSKNCPAGAKTKKKRSKAHWSAWTSWSGCSVTCATGKRLRLRQCEKRNRPSCCCSGKKSQYKSCFTQTCNKDNIIPPVVLLAGTDVQLHCPGGKDKKWITPYGKISFKKNHHPRFYVRTTHLRIDFIQVGDEGLYRCIYQENNQTDSIDAVLMVVTCYSGPCKNGGTCVEFTIPNTGLLYTRCGCKIHFSGDFCEEEFKNYWLLPIGVMMGCFILVTTSIGIWILCIKIKRLGK